MSRREGPSVALGLAAIVAAAALFVAARVLWQQWHAHVATPNDRVEGASPAGLGDGRQR